MALADRALVVGIDIYPGISSLSGAERDALQFHRWVTSPDGGGVDPANARLIVSSEFGDQTDANTSKPAREMIEDFFTEVDVAADENNLAGRGLKAGRRLWLFFSGHGFAPSLDRSGVLTANATPRRVHNVAARMWADRLHEGGWFDEVILFQDACRSRVGEADLSPPFLSKRNPVSADRKRFYAFAANNDKLAKEVKLPGGGVGGAFTATLLDGLRGKARDPRTGAVTSSQLKAYLQDNMKNLLPEEDLADDRIAKIPDVFDPDPFDIVPAARLAAPIDRFPVDIVPGQPGPAAEVVDSRFVAVEQVASIPPTWRVNLPRGFYKVVVSGGGAAMFDVTGATGSDRAPVAETVRV